MKAEASRARLTGHSAGREADPPSDDVGRKPESFRESIGSGEAEPRPPLRSPDALRGERW